MPLKYRVAVAERRVRADGAPVPEDDAAARRGGHRQGGAIGARAAADDGGPTLRALSPVRAGAGAGRGGGELVDGAGVGAYAQKQVGWRFARSTPPRRVRRREGGPCAPRVRFSQNLGLDEDRGLHQTHALAQLDGRAGEVLGQQGRQGPEPRVVVVEPGLALFRTCVPLVHRSPAPLAERPRVGDLRRVFRRVGGRRPATQLDRSQRALWSAASSSRTRRGLFPEVISGRDLTTKSPHAHGPPRAVQCRDGLVGAQC